MIFVANNTREIEKKNDIYKNKILKINQNIKIETYQKLFLIKIKTYYMRQGHR